VRFEISGGLS